jgi:hypothetical protein
MDGGHHRCKHALRPTRQREHRLQGCTSLGYALRVLSAYGPPTRPTTTAWAVSSGVPQGSGT